MRYAVAYDLGRFEKLVDKAEWSMHAYAVDAYYSPAGTCAQSTSLCARKQAAISVRVVESP